MTKRHVPLVIGGLLLAVFGSLTLAQEPVSQRDWDVSTSILGAHVERQEPISLTAGQVISRAVRVEPVRLRIAERITVEARMPPMLPKARVVERYQAIQPLQQGLEDSIGRVVSKAYSITRPVPTHDSGNSEVRLAAVCTVNSTADSGSGTLRQCLEDAVAGDTVTFDTGVFPPTSPVTISLSSELPWIITNSLTVDASDAGVILDGSGLSSGTGFVIFGADGVKIRGLQIIHFPLAGVAIAGGVTNTTIGGDRFTGSGPLGQGNLISGNGRAGVWIEASGTMSNTVLGNFIGTDLTGGASLGNAALGVLIHAGATNNIIGGDTPGAGNLISGNGDTGVWIEDVGTSGNQVLGNYVGTDVSGTAPLDNAEMGVLIHAGAANNTVGGDTPGAGNLISGNGDTGVWIEDVGTSGNLVLGNYIGTDVSGTAPLGNEEFGVFIGFGATNNTIGGDTPGSRNLISGNRDTGVWIQNTGTSGSYVAGNYIGTNVSGTASLGNEEHGVLVGFGATSNTIGGDTPGACNLISGNRYHGVYIGGSGASGNQVLGNYVGTNVSGTAALGNALVGVAILDGATDNTIGGDTPRAGNLISGNEYDGVSIQNLGTSGNQVMGNYIGTDVSGTTPLGNRNGVIIAVGAAGNTIGGDTHGKRNLISGNRDTGVWLQEPGTSGNRVLGNYIGTNVSGTSPLGNSGNGVFISWGATNNIVGGYTSEARNLISGNGRIGVFIQNAGTMSNTVLGNYIGTDVSGTVSLANPQAGVVIQNGATNNTIGGDTAGARNLISGNGEAGVWIEDVGTSENQVLGNHIGTDVSGTAPLGNAKLGVLIHAGATNNTIGGDTPGARNLISGNGEVDVWIEDVGTSENQVLGNHIGTDISGTAPFGNAKLGVLIHEGATNNTIGGDTPGARNLISGNGWAGVWLEDVGTSENQVLGNYIGTDASGTVSLANPQAGVVIQNRATNNTIGGDTPGARNLISGNGDTGVLIKDVGTSGNQVLGNHIGTDVSDTTPLGNRNGVVITVGAADNTIGGDTLRKRNLISGNRDTGVSIEGVGTSENQVLGNYIGTDASGSAPLGNAVDGVLIHAGATNNIIGGDTAGARNLISSNGQIGVKIEDSGTMSNSIQGNYIGTDVSGTASLGNEEYGVLVGFGATSNTIGINNTIVYNALAGVVVSGPDTLYNTVTRNVIHDNGGLPIDLVDLPIPLSPSPPVLICFSFLGNAVMGTTCPGCRVEIFANPTATPAGTIFLGDALADVSGGFSLALGHSPPDQYLAATATDLDGTTSEFSEGFSWFDHPCFRIYLPLVTKNE